MDGLYYSEAEMTIYVHPSKKNQVRDSVFFEMGSLLFKSSEAFDGVVLPFDANILSQKAKILSRIHPYFGFKVNALVIFSLKPNMLVEGKVVKILQESIHIIVLGFASAIIKWEDIREEFVFKVKNGEEVFASTLHKRHRIKVGTMISFLVKSMDEQIIHISGSLDPENTGDIRWLEKNVEDGTISTEESQETKVRIEQENMMSRWLLEDQIIAIIIQRSRQKRTVTILKKFKGPSNSICLN